MSVIKIEDLTFAYPSSYDNVFENVNLRIDTDWKLGLIGRNGRGKTTLLRLLTGKYEYGGKIESAVTFDYFPYDVRGKDRPAEDILREICPVAEEWQFIREMTWLDIDPGNLYRPFATLSNGEQTKILLAALFLNEGHFLLIDEPTNHLDMHAREVLSAYLKKKKSFILVSHDRAFLDGCVDHILSVNRSDIELQKGNCSSYLTNFEYRQELERRQDIALRRDIVRLKETARRTSDWADKTEASKYGKQDSGLKADKGFVGHKSAKLMKRAKAAEARKEKEIDRKSELLKNAETEEKLKLSPLKYRAERLASFVSVSPCYGDRGVCAPVTFDITRGDRIAIDGRNGSGKSSLLKLLYGCDICHTGRMDKSSGLKISYVEQDTSHLTGTLSELAESYDIDESLLKAVLHKMGFTSRQFEKDMSEFSDGQKKKALLAKSLCEQAHLYVWDEPLNYIDIYSRMAIESLIKEYGPTMIFVEHDKAFRDAVATKVIEI